MGLAGLPAVAFFLNFSKRRAAYCSSAALARDIRGQRFTRSTLTQYAVTAETYSCPLFSFLRISCCLSQAEMGRHDQ